MPKTELVVFVEGKWVRTMNLKQMTFEEAQRFTDGIEEAVRTEKIVLAFDNRKHRFVTAIDIYLS